MNSWLNLEDKVAIVTGGASGIGKEIVKTLLNNGMKVVVGDLKISDEVVEEIDNENAIFIETDVTIKSSVDNMVNEGIKKFGKIDVLVNNAGINFQDY